jgi:uncharacterized protein (DUF934 family)
VKIGYWAVFNYDEKDKIDYGISIYFPDVSEAYTCASDDENGKKMAKEVLELATYDLNAKELPKASDYDTLAKNLTENEKLYWIEYDTDEIQVIREFL